MKSRLLVILVSEQTIPNFLFIKTFITENSKVLFISTKRMEDTVNGNRREWIIKAARLNEKQALPPIEVNPERKEDVISKMYNFNFDSYDEIHTNITGGTKMMSLASYEFLKNKTANLWYLPIGSSEYHIVDNSDHRVSITYEICAEEYLDCCGIHKSENRFSEKKPLLPEAYAQRFFDLFTLGKIDLDVIESIRLLFRADKAPLAKVIGRKTGIILDEIEDLSFIKDFLTGIEFPSKEIGKFFKAEMDFITGGWYEEYCYYILKNQIGIKEENLKMGVVLNPSPANLDKASYFTSNDLDVLFVANNRLYVVECKSAGMDQNELFNKTVYLQAALKKYFMLDVNSVLFTLSEMSEKYKEKANTLKIRAFDKKIFLDFNNTELLKLGLGLS